MKLPLSVLVVLKVRDEVFFIARQNHLRVFPGYTSFPGGKADKDESDWSVEDMDPSLLGTARREVLEELGYDLKKAHEDGHISGLRLIGEATTPDFNPYRFEAKYLLCELKEKPKFYLDSNEIKEAFWANPTGFKKRYDKGELIVIPPMWKILKYLEEGRADYASFDNVQAEGKVPALESIHGVVQIMPLSNTLPPAARTNAFQIGDILVDPSPKDDLELEKLYKTLNEKEVKKILITHHHQDHHQFSREIAKSFSAPLLMSQFTKERLTRLGGKDYFKNNQVITVKEGDVVASWLNRPVKVYEIPGHDEGQLGLAPDNMAWFIAGDLFQGIGTVVVGGEEGDMKKYFSTLQRVIDLNPKAVYPSHGIPLGGTHIISKTLEHRKLRESQIRELRDKGYSPEGMLKKIYFDLPKALRKYALANIKSHLEKLNQG